jgi:transposase, IS6 family
VAESDPFKWRHYQDEIIILCARWHAPELEKRIRPHLRTTNNSYRVDETYIKIGVKWYYLYVPEGTD